MSCNGTLVCAAHARCPLSLLLCVWLVLELLESVVNEKNEKLFTRGLNIGCKQESCMEYTYGDDYFGSVMLRSSGWQDAGCPGSSCLFGAVPL